MLRFWSNILPTPPFSCPAGVEATTAPTMTVSDSDSRPRAQSCSVQTKLRFTLFVITKSTVVVVAGIISYYIMYRVDVDVYCYFT